MIFSHRVRVYRVVPDELASRFHLENPDEYFARYPHAFRNSNMWTMKHWLPDPVRVTHSFGTLTDFGWLMPGALVWSRLQDVEGHYRLEADVLQAECEWLPLNLPGSKSNQHLALNPVINNALDLARSEVRRDDSGRIVAIERYAFVDHRLTNAIFRLPYGSPWEVFTIYQIDEPEDLPFADLFSAYTKLGLKGLRFEPVWETKITT